jgi:hypothetical protein
MDLENISREELIARLIELNDLVENTIVLWGGKREFREMFAEVAKNEQGEYTDEEAKDASTILESDGAFDAFLELVRDSFERGGINYALQEKISVIMQEVARRYARN